MRGMGRSFKRGDTWWIAYFHRGKEYRESTKATGTKGERRAAKLLKKRLGEIGGGLFIGPQEEKVTFEEMAADLERDYAMNRKRSAATLACKVKHLRESFALTRAVDITTDRIRAHVTARQQAGAKNATINRELAALKRMFALTIQAGRLSRRPHVPMLEENNARQGFVDHESFLNLREVLPDYLKDPVAFLYFSGWRVGEMRGLEWRDVDLAGRVIRLRIELSKNKNGRVLPLAGQLLEVVERAAERRRLDCARVFHIKGRPLGSFRKTWQQACVKAGLGAKVPTGRLTRRGKPELKYQGLTPHDLRRSAVRNMVRAGIPERVCMALSGHKTRAIFDRYNVVSENDLNAAAHQLNEHLQEQPAGGRVVKMGAARRGA